MSIDWQKKLSSRKFWKSFGGLIASVLAIFNYPESEIVQVTGIIGAFGSVAVYVLAEASIDKARLKKDEEV